MKTINARKVTSMDLLLNLLADLGIKSAWNGVIDMSWDAIDAYVSRVDK